MIYLSSFFSVAHNVDLHFAVQSNRLNDTLLVQVSQADLGNGTSNTKLFRNSSNSDQLHLWNILQQVSIGLLVEHDLVVQLLLNTALGPLLLLLLSARGFGGSLSGLNFLALAL